MAMNARGNVHGSRDRRRRDRRAHAGADPRQGGHPVPGVRVFARDQADWRGDQPPAARDQGAGPARPRQRPRARRGGDARGGLLQPLRPADLPRAARLRCRLRAAAVLRPPWRSADGAARRRPEAPGGGSRPLRVEVRRVRAGRDRAAALFRSTVTGEELAPQRGSVVVACDGIHSVIRKQLHPGEGEPLYSGVNMWRGVTRWPAFLSGASMVRAGWLKCGKMVIYPIRERIDAEGRQLVNWVAEIETPRHQQRDWNRRGSLDDFLGAFEEWHFDWLDVPAFIRAADAVLEFPMVDQDTLPFWTQGRVTLLGDAAHPMVPRGSNGAGQAILDARALAD